MPSATASAMSLRRLALDGLSNRAANSVGGSPGMDRRQELRPRRARPHHEAVAAPIETRVERHRDHRHAQSSRTCARCPAGSPDRRSGAFRVPSGIDDDAAARAPPAPWRSASMRGMASRPQLAVDRDGVERLRGTPEERNVDQLALGDVGRLVVGVGQDREDVPVALVLGRR